MEFIFVLYTFYLLTLVMPNMNYNKYVIIISIDKHTRQEVDRMLSKKILDYANEKRLKSHVEASFTRCLNYDIDENMVFSKRIIEGEELSNRLKANEELIVTAEPFINQLNNFVKGSNFFIILTDAEGCILSITGDDKIAAKAKSFKMVPGAFMNEENIGTNAMGTALAEEKPVQISGEEHFIKAYHTWTCSGAPIRNPEGRIIGSLDLTGECNNVHSHTLGMVVAAVRAIEMILSQKKNNEVLRANNLFIQSLFNSIQEGIILCGLDGEILSSNNQACKMFGYKKEECNIFKINDLITGWSKLKEDALKAKDFHNEDIMINARTNKLYFNVSAYPVVENNVTFGIILMFEDIKKVRKMANNIFGQKAIYTFDKIVGESPKFVELMEFAKKIADSKSTILITGESGCGKELFAQAIQNHSSRKNEAFVAINCGAIPRNLIEAELFGYVEGAFTGAKRGGQIGKFEVADGGTIFLDEIGEMPLEMQTKLLRVIEEGTVIRVGGINEITVNVRIIAATNKKLREEVNKGNFRKDLFYRLNVIPIKLPSLRERVEDIPLLTNYFFKKISFRINKKPIKISEKHMKILKEYNWPGNIRELENFIELAINKEKIPIELLREDVKEKPVNNTVQNELLTLEELEKQYIKNILSKVENNITTAAKILGIGRNTLYRKIEKYSL